MSEQHLPDLQPIRGSRCATLVYYLVINTTRAISKLLMHEL